MLNEGKFGVQEAVCLSAMSIFCPIYFTFFETKFNTANAAWSMNIISDLIAMLAFTFILLLMRQYPDKNIIEIFHLSMGRVFGFIFSLLFCYIFLSEAALLLREFTEELKIFIFDNTPELFLEVYVTIGVVCICFMGLETLARVSKIFFIFVIFGTLLILLLGEQKYDVTNLFPIFGYGLYRDVYYGFIRSSIYGDVMILTVFAGSLQGFRYVRKTGYLTLLISGLVFEVTMLCIDLTFPPQSLEGLTSPLFILTRGINYGAFLQRFDPIFVLVWSVVAVIAVSTLFYTGVSCYCKTFRLSDTRPVIIMMTVPMLCLAILPKSIMDLTLKNIRFARDYSWIVYYLLPIIALITVGVKKLIHLIGKEQEQNS